jgi:hypothetical protein
MITEAMLVIRQNQVPVVFSYFEDKLAEVNSFLSAEGVPYFHINNNNLDEATSQSKVIFVCPASLISSTAMKGFLNHLVVKNTIQFLFDGHYPLPSREIKVIEKLSSYLDCPITFYSSMDEPIFKTFGAERLMSLLDQLGMNESEFIEHALVRKAMTRAREKMGSMVPREIAAETEKEWFLKNVKQ